LARGSGLYNACIVGRVVLGYWAVLHQRGLHLATLWPPKVGPPDRLKKGCTGPPLGITTARRCKTNQREDSVDSGPNPAERNEASHKQQREEKARGPKEQRREREERLERKQIRQEEREDREQVRQEEREERKRERQKARGQEESSP
jgi:hypothetical protein